MDAPLAKTRLLPPRVHRAWVERRRLLERIDRAELLPLTLVVAPPGFGKTGLLAQWAARHPGAVAWLTLDERDDDLVAFTSMLAAAVNAVAPETIVAPLRYFDFAGDASDPGVVAAHVLNDLSDLAVDLAIVVDDLHLLTRPGPNAVLEAIATAGIPGLRLIALSRSEPPWNLAPLRASGRLEEIRASDLRLTVEEVTDYARHAGWDAISRQDADTVHAVSQGWLTAARFLCAAPDRLRDHADGVSHGRGAEAVARLLGEALAAMPPLERDLLLRLAVPERIHPSLAEALGAGVAAPGERRAIYHRLVEDGLFLSRPDAERWSGLHAEVREAMLARLEATAGADGMRWLQATARDWFLAQGMYEEALHHARLAHGDEDAARVLRAAMRPTLAAERWRDLERWLGQLPPDLVRGDPELLLGMGWMALGRHDVAGAAGRLAEADARLAAESGQDPRQRALLAAELDVLRGAVAYAAGDPETCQRRCAPAIRALPADRVYSLGHACTYLVLSRFLLDPAIAPEGFADILASASLLPAAVNLQTWSAVGCVAFQQGDLRRLVRMADRMRSLGQAHDAVMVYSWAEALTAISRYVLNDLDGAIACATALLERATPVSRIAVREALFCLALAYEAKGQPEDADLTLDRIEELTVDEGVLADLTGVEALRARFALERGDAAAARAWCGEAGEPDAVQSAHSFVDPRVVRAAIAVDLGIDLERTAANLDRYLASPTMADTLMRRVELLILRAQAAERLGDRAAAARGIARALRGAEPFDLARIFLDRGPGLLAVLDLAPPDAAPAVETTRLRDAIAAEAARGRPRRPGRLPVAAPEPARPLSERELEVLELVAARLTNKEIGAELRISPLTVKRHTVNIYAKLGVASRRQAIQLARDAGIVDVPEIGLRPPRPLEATG